MAQKGWLLQLDKCTGCESCAVACKSENNTQPLKSPLLSSGTGVAVETSYRRVISQESGTYPHVLLRFVTMACNHCESPACLAACPVSPKAITKRPEDGIVLIDQDRCVGCKYCVWVCPYGAPRYNEITQKVEKCTLCVHRLEGGLKPACVTTCTGDALHLEDHFDFSRSGEKRPTNFAHPWYTHPSIRFEDA